MTNTIRASDIATPVRVPKAAALVAAQLRGQLVRGELAEGDALPPEHELMQRFGVSRPTLREAFRVLEGEALLSIQRGARGGARIHSSSGATISTKSPGWSSTGTTRPRCSNSSPDETVGSAAARSAGRRDHRHQPPCGVLRGGGLELQIGLLASPTTDDAVGRAAIVSAIERGYRVASLRVME